ncbi:MAG: nuclear transport factor 2 family protein [Dehalococcoidia bacterium]|nr:nuclear transport factor 2 family protein [Dehalococcoidia bacterium]
MSNPPDLHAAATALVDAYAACWSRRDFAGLKALWDTDDPGPLYLAEEILEPLIGWDAIDRYWAMTSGLVTRMWMRTADLQARPLGPDHAIVFYNMDWNLTVGDQDPIAADVRVIMILRKKPDGWKVCHYAEASIGPLTYLRRAYRRAVAPEFAERVRAERAARQSASSGI